MVPLTTSIETFSEQPHAVKAIQQATGVDRYEYDANGNITLRVELSGTQPITYYQEFDIENHLAAVTVTDGITQTVTRFAYDGDGALEMKIAPDGAVTVYPGPYIEYEASGGDPVPTSYYFHAGRRVARWRGGTVHYLYGDHLGSTSLTTNDTGGGVVRQLYHPYGTVRWSSGTLPTDFTFTGQRSDPYTQLVQMGARWYEVRIGRWVSADTLVPDPADPQSLNRYTYVFGNPLRLVDPSGYDPLDAAWRREFREAHGGRDAGPLDILIRLFSIAFPDEWGSITHDAIYTPEGELRPEALEELFTRIPEGRDWAGMPNATEHMGEWYEPHETEQLVRDIGSLFAGLLNRFEQPSGWAAVRRGWVRASVRVGRRGLPQELLGTDPTGNVHHWAWSLNLGYCLGATLGSDINLWREVDTANWNIATALTDQNHVADIMLGHIGANMGSFVRRWPWGPRSPHEFSAAWRTMPLTVSAE